MCDMGEPRVEHGMAWHWQWQGYRQAAAQVTLVLRCLSPPLSCVCGERGTVRDRGTDGSLQERRRSERRALQWYPAACWGAEHRVILERRAEHRGAEHRERRALRLSTLVILYIYILKRIFISSHRDSFLKI